MSAVRRTARLFAGLVALAMAPVFAAAQGTYPSRPIDFIVPWGPGGGADLLARIGSKLMEPILGVSLPVINVPGATGQVGLTKLISGPADGYSIEVMTGDTYALFSAPNPRFNLNQIHSLGIMILQPSGFYVAQDAPWKNWNELLQAAKTKTLRVATTGFGSPDDITVNYFRSLGYHFENVPYAKPGERYTSILGGHADVLYEQTGDVRSYVDGKQMRPIVLFYPKPVDIGPFKGIPVTGQMSMHISLPQLRTVIVKAGTDPAIIKKLSDALAKVAETPEYKKYLADQYADPDSYMTADKANEYMAAWLEKAHKIAAESAHKGLNQ
jgi:putative tricarboxylic transport membrane protein